MVFGIITGLCNHYQNIILGHFCPLQRNPSSQASFSLLPTFLRNHESIGVSASLSNWDIPHTKGYCVECGLLRLVSVTWGDVFGCVRVVPCEYFIPLHGC